MQAKIGENRLSSQLVHQLLYVPCSLLDVPSSQSNHVFGCVFRMNQGFAEKGVVHKLMRNSAPSGLQQNWKDILVPWMHADSHA